jgi:transposase
MPGSSSRFTTNSCKTFSQATLACLYYRLATKGQVWVDRGTAEFEQRKQQRDLATLQRKARSLGLQLVPAA